MRSSHDENARHVTKFDSEVAQTVQYRPVIPPNTCINGGVARGWASPLTIQKEYVNMEARSTEPKFETDFSIYSHLVSGSFPSHIAP